MTQLHETEPRNRQRTDAELSRLLRTTIYHPFNERQKYIHVHKCKLCHHELNAAMTQLRGCEDHVTVISTESEFI